MSVGLTMPPVLEPQSDLSSLKGQKSTTIEAEKARLKKATKEFESFFMYFMLKTMRQTIPEKPLDEGSPFSNTMGKDTFTQMFDMEISRSMSTGGGTSISEILYKSMEKKVEAQFSQGEEKVEIQPIQREEARVPIKIRPQPTSFPSKVSTSKKLDVPKSQIPIRAVSVRTPADNIMVKYGKFIDAAAAETKLDSTLIASVIQTESAGNPKAESHAGAKGLMQLIDATASDYGVRNVFDPEENIMAGSRFLKDMVDRFGDVELALAAYNAGPGNVDKYGGIPPFRETQNYVQRVTKLHFEADTK